VRRLLFLVTFFLIALAGGFSPPAFALEQPREIRVLIDGLPVTFDVQPVIQDNRTMVPFRAVAEALNVKISWDDPAQTVNASDGKTTIRLQIGNSTAYRNEKPITLDVPPFILDGRTLIPLRFFSEAFGCSVAWDTVAYNVKITSPPKAMTVVGFYALGDSQTSSWTNLFEKAYPDTGTGNTDIVSELALGWYSMDEKGNLLTKSGTGWQRPDGWQDILKAAGKYHLRTQMVVQMTDGDGNLSNLLTNEAAMNRAINDILKEAGQYQGINLDFEGLGWKDEGERLTVVRDGFTRFVRLLSGQSKKAGLALSLTLHAPNSAYKGYDYRALGDAADRIIIMAYDYGPKTEPVSLVTQAVEMAKAVVPPEKLILGISAPSETPESILNKVGITKRYNLNGVAIWRLGLVSDEMWNILKSTVRARS